MCYTIYHDYHLTLLNDTLLLRISRAWNLVRGKGLFIKLAVPAGITHYCIVSAGFSNKVKVIMADYGSAVDNAGAALY